MLTKVGTSKEDLSKKVNYIFAYSVIWGVGATFNQAYYDKVINILL